MKRRTTLMCTCTIVCIFLAVVSCTGTKQKKLNAKNWGPQSMMYLKGKCKAVNGRRFAQDYDEDNVYKSALNNWSGLLKGFQHLKPVGVRKIRGLVASENFLFHYLR